MRTKKKYINSYCFGLYFKKEKEWRSNYAKMSLRHEVDSSINIQGHKNRIDYEICIIFCRYTRNLVDAGNGKFNLMVLCWNTSQGSAIHDHANAHCFMKVLDGHSQEELFEWPPGSEDDGEMKSKGKKLYEKDQVAYISGE